MTNPNNAVFIGISDIVPIFVDFNTDENNLNKKDPFWEENTKLSEEEIDTRFPKKTAAVLKMEKKIKK